MCLNFERFEWKVYANSKLKKVIEESVKPAVVSLLGLFSSKCWNQEIVIFFKLFKKIFIRFKTCRLTRLMKQLKQQLNKFMNCDLWHALQTKPFVEEQFDVKTGCILLPTTQSLNAFRSQLKACDQFLEKILQFSLSSFEHCVLWLTLGHNLPHYCTALASIARINIICRAFKVYISDLCEGVKNILKIPELSSSGLVMDIANMSLMSECTDELFSDCSDLSSPTKQTSEEREEKRKLIESNAEVFPEESVIKDVLEEKNVNSEKNETNGETKRVKRKVKSKLKPKTVNKVYKYVSSLKVLKLKF